MPKNYSEAEILWNDVLDVLQGQDISNRLLSMLQACKPVQLNNLIITVEAPSGFAQHLIEDEKSRIEAALSQAAFEPIQLSVSYARGLESKFAKQAQELSSYAPPSEPPTLENGGFINELFGKPSYLFQNDNEGVEKTKTSISLTEFASLNKGASSLCGSSPHGMVDKSRNPLVESITENDSLLTFDTFVEADENRFALQAAKQVANGVSQQFNPLFIHGSSGLGKTHLLRAIQNYIGTNDPDRQCLYRVASDFISDYTNAMKENKRRDDNVVGENLKRNYHNIDVLILDDIQNIRKAQHTMDFFFETFEYLVSQGKQIVLAADEPPSNLGMPERIESRIGSGLSVSIETPSLEFKRLLITTFYERFKNDGMPGDLSEDDLNYMAEVSGGNIRSIRSFVQECLFKAERYREAGEELTQTDIAKCASERWQKEGRVISIEDVQRFIQKQYDISRADLIGSKRSASLKQPRHIAIWLCREVTDNTLAEIGKQFGGRSHATIKHSLAWVEQTAEHDRVLYDRLESLRERISSEA